jgi:hypothetical protein
MFTKLKSVKDRTPKEIITIQQLHSIVQNNPNKEYIEYIRGLEYKSKEYNSSKLKLNVITPHGIFSGGICNNNISDYSGYLFYDVDGIYDKKELEDTISLLNDTFPISFLQRSLSGKGFHFLIKYIHITPNDTFEYLYSYVRQLLLDKGFNIDLSAAGLSRKMIISSDDKCILNNEVSLSIDLVSYNNFCVLRNTNGRVKLSKRVKVIPITPNDTFRIIPIKELYTQIKLQTQYTKDIDGDYIIEDMEFYTILIPEKINDGTKRKLYTRIVNALYFINGNNISTSQIYSYLYYVNNRATPSMNDFKLKELVGFLCDSIEQEGIRIKPRIKRIHFNKKSDFTKKQKQIMGARLGAKLKNNKSIMLIEEARNECARRNELPTQKRIQELTGLGIATVKRNWNKEMNDLNDIEIPEKEIEVLKEPILTTIEEDKFFSIQEDIKEEIKKI